MTASAIIDLEDDVEVEAEEPAKKKKKRQCVGCDSDLSEGTIVCAMCACTTSGQRHEAGKEAVLRQLYMFAPVIVRYIARGGRSIAGLERDAAKKLAARARKLNFGIETSRPHPTKEGEFVWVQCVTSRWDGSEEFRQDMMSRYNREDMVEFDRLAESEGQPPPKKGDGTGRSRQAIEKYAGEYQRVSVGGAMPEVAMTRQPQYTHDRNAVRQGEFAIRTGKQPPEGIGAKGYGRKGQTKGKAVTSEQRTDDHANQWSSASQDTWSTTWGTSSWGATWSGW